MYYKINKVNVVQQNRQHEKKELLSQMTVSAISITSTISAINQINYIHMMNESISTKLFCHFFSKSFATFSAFVKKESNGGSSHRLKA